VKIIKDVPVYLNNQFHNDNIGPQVFLLQGNYIVDNGSIVNKNLPVEIVIEDPQGVNLMDDIQHNVRYWFNNDNYIYYLNSNLFEYDKNTCGKTSASFSFPDNLKSGKNLISIEAWDNGNNRTLLEYSFIVENNNETYVNNLYNFPNPFKDDTFFTFYLSQYPADVEISIYTVNGEKIKTLKKSCDSYYNVLKWDGKTDSGKELSNGPYIYSFKSNAFINGLNKTYETINKIAKLK